MDPAPMEVARAPAGRFGNENRSSMAGRVTLATGGGTQTISESGPHERPRGESDLESRHPIGWTAGRCHPFRKVRVIACSMPQRSRP